MSLLKRLEEKIQGLFEGGFGRAFKSPVQPVELAHKLVKEMGDNKVISVSRVYAPNEYTLFLSPGDAEQFEAYQEHLAADLSAYLVENARREGYDLISTPEILFETDEDLEEGEFGIATRMVSGPEPAPEAPPVQGEVGQTVIYRPPEALEGAGGDAGHRPAARERVTLAAAGSTYEVDGRVVLIGRSRQADFVLNDPNASRRHAELRRQGDDYIIVDLDSLNGIEVNGKRVKSAKLMNGDLITIGTTRVRFERKLC